MRSRTAIGWLGLTSVPVARRRRNQVTCIREARLSGAVERRNGLVQNGWGFANNGNPVPGSVEKMIARQVGALRQIQPGIGICRNTTRAAGGGSQRLIMAGEAHVMVEGCRSLHAQTEARALGEDGPVGGPVIRALAENAGTPLLAPTRHTMLRLVTRVDRLLTRGQTSPSSSPSPLGIRVRRRRHRPMHRTCCARHVRNSESDGRILARCGGGGRAAQQQGIDEPWRGPRN